MKSRVLGLFLVELYYSVAFFFQHGFCCFIGPLSREYIDCLEGISWGLLPSRLP